MPGKPQGYTAKELEDCDLCSAALTLDFAKNKGEDHPCKAILHHLDGRHEGESLDAALALWKSAEDSALKGDLTPDGFMEAVYHAVYPTTSTSWEDY